MEDIKPIIAKNISTLRTSAEMTQVELAEKLNYSDKAVSKWERGESIPDIAVLKKIADLFHVPLDYLVSEEHEKKEIPIEAVSGQKIKNRGFITGMSILLVWLVATLIFVIIDIVTVNTAAHFLSFAYAVPISMIVWLIFNSIWFNRRRNFLIISLLMWTLLGAVCLTFLPYSNSIWLIFLLGLPGQVIIFMWSRLKYKK